MEQLKIQIANGHITVNADKNNRGKCRKCGKDILWVKTSFGNSMPVSENHDGTLISHFADCPAAGYFRKKK